MRQEYSMSVNQHHTAYEASELRLQSHLNGQHAQTMVAENARAQELREQQTSELAPGAYMMGKIVERNGSRYRSGRGDHGRYMTTDDYADLYRSRRVHHVREQSELGDIGDGVAEMQYSRAAAPAYIEKTIQREEPVHSVRESGEASRRGTAPAQARRVSVPGVGIPHNGSSRQTQVRPRTATGDGAGRVRKAPTTAPIPSAGKVSAAPVARRETAAVSRTEGQNVSQWMPSSERYIRVRNEKRFPIAMVMMIVAVSVSLMLIVCGSVMISHMEREVCAMNNELKELQEIAKELEGQLAIKNDPVKMEQMAAEMGMVHSEYVEMRILQADPEEYTVVYDTEEPKPLTLATLLSAIGFFKD